MKIGNGIKIAMISSVLMTVNSVCADVMANLLEDPGFENLAADEPTQGGTPWEDNNPQAEKHIEVRNGISQYGTNSVAFNHYTRGGYLYQKLGIQVEADTSYELSVWMKLDEASSNPAHTNWPTINMALAGSDTENGNYDWLGVGKKKTGPSVTNQWKQFTFEIDSNMLTNEVGRWLEVRFVKENAPTEYRIFLDDASFGIQTPDVPTNYLIGIEEDFDYGSDNTGDIPNWYDSNAGTFYNHQEDPNSPFDVDTGEVGLQWNAGTNMYLYRGIGGYSGESYMDYSLNIASWNGTTNDISGELLVRIFKNNVFTPAQNVDLAADTNSVLVAGDTHNFVSLGDDPITNLTGTLDLSGVALESGDRLFFMITYTNPNERSFTMDDVFLALPAYEIGDVTWTLSDENGLTLSWDGDASETFALQFDENLVSAPGWSNLVEGIEGMDGMMSVTTDTSRAQSFYRIIVE